MKLSICLAVFLLWSLSAPLAAAEALDLEDPTTRTNYSLGHQIGGDAHLARRKDSEGDV